MLMSSARALRGQSRLGKAFAECWKYPSTPLFSGRVTVFSGSTKGLGFFKA
jgi:hypothetical protein